MRIKDGILIFVEHSSWHLAYGKARIWLMQRTEIVRRKYADVCSIGQIFRTHCGIQARRLRPVQTPEIPQHAAEFLFLIPVAPSAGSTSSRPPRSICTRMHVCILFSLF
jgi:hypothetical protein